MNKNNYFSENIYKSDELNIRLEIEKYLIYWKWFVLGIIISFLSAFFYLRYSTEQYSASASIMIKDNKKSGISAELAAFEDLGIVGGSANNTDNEIEILKSRKIIGKVVDSLDLNVRYFLEGGIKETEKYNLSFLKVNLLDKVKSDIDTSFSIKIINNNSFELRDSDSNFISNFNFNEKISSDIGSFIVERNFNESHKDFDEIIIKISKVENVVSSFKNKINISSVSKQSSVLNLSLISPVREKAQDIINVLIDQYNSDAINDKNEVSKKTSDFINDRLKKVSKELADLDDKAKEYKSSKGFTGVSKEAELVLESAKENDLKLTELNTQLSIIKWTFNYLNNNSNTHKIIPSLGLNDISIANSINEFNQLVQKRNLLIKNAGAKNPTLIELEENLVTISKGLRQSLANNQTSIELQIRQFNKQSSKINTQVASIPAKERGFIDIARQLEIVSGLYIYLLKKKEETDISLAVTVPNAKIIDKAYSAIKPVAPKRNIIYLSAFLLGIIIPFIIIYLKDLLDTKVHNKQDIETELSIPFLGDIPKSDSKEKIVIGNDVRSSTSEAFRLVRTNLDFMLSGKRKESKSIFITSTTSGEGKSFISINVASTLALSGKKVLLMGMDLRAPKVTEYLGLPDRKGVTNYITDHDLIIDDLIFNIPQVEGLDIISSGVIPPNPAELLMSNRIDNLFTIVKEDYDFVIVDTAPVNLVTDTLLIAKYADMFMYVVRANYLDKRLLAVPQSLYNEKRLPNMAIILNDTDPKRSYGYGYGGYGYGYVEVEKKWYEKLFNRS